MFNVNEQRLKVNKDILESLSGEEIFKTYLKKYLQTIKNLISAPQDVFNEIYLPLIYKLAEFLQAIPYSGNDLIAYGFLERQLQLAIQILKLRRGMLLPKSADSETVAAKEAAWTYALFSASLLQDLELMAHNREVDLYYKTGEKISTWCPLSGSLYEKGMYYQFDFKEFKSSISDHILMAAITARIVPSIGFRFLSEDKKLFNVWCETVFRENTKNDVYQIIQSAASKADIQIFKYEASHTEKTEETLTTFKNWIASESQSTSKLVFKISSGLFVSEIKINEFCDLHKENKENLINQLDKENFLITNNDSAYHTLKPKKFEDPRTLQGLVLNLNIFPDNFKNFPLNTTYKEAEHAYF